MMHAGYPGHFSDTRANTDCKYFLEGRCSLGDACPFRHRADLFNTAARAKATLAPQSQPIICHFYLHGKCTKGDACAFQHPKPAQLPATRPAVQPQEEMHIDFEDDESPRQPEQSRPAKTVASRQPPVQDRLAPKLQQGPPLSRRGGEQSAQLPVSSRLGVQSGAARRADALQATVRRPMNSAEHQDDTEKAKGSVFERLSMSRGGTALDRLSTPAVSADIRPNPRPITRPMDAAELLVQNITAKARVGRKEAELVRPGAAARSPGSGQAARQGSSELQPSSIATRRLVALNRGAKATPVPVHAPKFASPATSEDAGPRKSALERIAMPRANGTSPTSSSHAPTSSSVTAAKSRRASVVPYTSTRLRPTAPPSQTPSQVTGAGTLSATPAAGPAAAAPIPSSEPSTGGIDRRGRQRITWQPPTTSQKDADAQEARANVSKRKASDAALPALDSAASAAADGVSPPKRIKAQIGETDKQAAGIAQPSAQPSAQPEAQPAEQAPAQQAQVTGVSAGEGEQQPDIPDDEQQLEDSTMEVGEADVDYADQGALLDEDGQEDVLYEDDFDDEAAMRELEALG